MKQIALDIGLADGPTFASFLPGPNHAALDHLRSWVEQGGADQQTVPPVPVYLWGTGGSGKTHLLLAAREALCARGASVGWLDAGTEEPLPFDETWSAVLMDDVHLYPPARQHTAFNWFVHAQAARMPVMAAGNLPPAGLNLREDLRTRLGWGHVHGLQLLEEGELRAVLHRAAQSRGLSLGEDVTDFMLTRFSRDLGSLMELLRQLDAYALRTQRAITIPLLKAMLEEV
ncbi:DnaA regulatory inactivator Hda [Hylemonella gracilis str. Niagara R]|uniref:DnaA regulatory inactivator Hda n=1 Tax=Hylemonella gracilis str. Niagara R TaxID=1458275 RepID=A0A016XGW4_9BURK|nr:DnaA regulatory inactivator Hda [Hylemonella gracilis]EYC51130.1 DnaA regulatory inactivator Hda [Hylemonella gracilis str. Niagara R]